MWLLLNYQNFQYTSDAKHNNCLKAWLSYCRQHCCRNIPVEVNVSQFSHVGNMGSGILSNWYREIGKYDITREDYESKCNILRSQFTYQNMQTSPDFFRSHFLIVSMCSPFSGTSTGSTAMIFLSHGQTIATCQHNILQHCWAQHVACVWTPCWDMLPVVGSSLKMVKFKPATPNMSQQGGQTCATCYAQQCCNMLRWHVVIVWPQL